MLERRPLYQDPFSRYGVQRRRQWTHTREVAACSNPPGMCIPPLEGGGSRHSQGYALRGGGEAPGVTMAVWAAGGGGGGARRREGVYH